MSFAAPLPVDAAFAAFGEAVTISPTGAAVAVTAIRRAPDVVTTFGGGSVIDASLVLEIRASEAALVAGGIVAGTVIRVGGQDYTVQGVPEFRDPLRLVLTVKLR